MLKGRAKYIFNGIRHETKTQKLGHQPRHTTPRLRNNKKHTRRKETGGKCNTTKNRHQTNTQEDKYQSYITTGTTGRTV
jgi:hypothetical protein